MLYTNQKKKKNLLSVERPRYEFSVISRSQNLLKRSEWSNERVWSIWPVDRFWERLAIFLEVTGLTVWRFPLLFSCRFAEFNTSVICQVAGGLRLRCIVVAKFSRWRRRFEKMSNFCPSFRKVLTLTRVVFLASSERTHTKSHRRYKNRKVCYLSNNFLVENALVWKPKAYILNLC